MGELVGGALLGFAVAKLLDEVVHAFKLLRKRPANLVKLQDLVERLQPSVQELSREVQDERHPAGKWLIQLHVELEKARNLATASNKVYKNIFRLVGMSKMSVELYARIQALVQEAPALLLASGIVAQRILVDNGEKILMEMSVSQEKMEELLRGLSNIRLNTDAQREVSQLVEEVYKPGNSNQINFSAAVVAHALSGDVPKPEVTFGGEEAAMQLTKRLLSGTCKKWVGLWGMGGIGKTLAARKAYHDLKVRDHFSGGIYWLTVSKDQPGIKHLFRQLLEQLDGSSAGPELPENLEEAKCMLKRKLDDRNKVLLVLDDVWQKCALDSLNLISDDKNGVILLMTRDKGILEQVVDFDDIVEIQPLSKEDGWKLFSWHAFDIRRKAVPRDLEVVPKDIAMECRGLPLALEVIGSTMANKELLADQKALGLSSLRVWEVALMQLRHAHVSGNEYEKLYLKLQVTVDDLDELDSRLRDCFCYFAAFPEDEQVAVDKLVHMWIAEGLVQEQEDVGISLTSQEQAKILLGLLVAKSMINLGGYSGYCTIHDVMRDVAQRNLKWNFATREQIAASDRDCQFAPGLHESKFPKEWRRPATTVERSSVEFSTQVV